MINFIRTKVLKKFDKTLILYVVILLSISLLSLYSATYYTGKPNFVFKQLLWFCVGLILLYYIAKINYHRLIEISTMLFPISVAVLGIILIIGKTRLGAQRWLDVGFFTFQPSEITKLTLVLFLSWYLARNKHAINKPMVIAGAFIITGIPFLLVMLQPDLGTAIVYTTTLFCMLYIAGVRLRYFIGSMILGAIASPLFWLYLKDYQKKRLLVFMNPDIDPLGMGYTITQSKISVGSGRFFGKGWLSGSQNQLNFLPERHTDFIFSVIGEEWGFIGSIFLIIIFYLFFRRVAKIIEYSQNLHAKLLTAGIASFILFQFFVNILMTTGFCPVVGMPLPFISYGGTSLITSLLGLGIIFNINHEDRILRY